jgi:hypothetical protein
VFEDEKVKLHTSKAALIRKPLLLLVIAPTPARSGSGSLQLSCVSLVDPSIVSEESGVRSVTISMTLNKFLTPKASLTHYLFFL